MERFEKKLLELKAKEHDEKPSVEVVEMPMEAMQPGADEKPVEVFGSMKSADQPQNALIPEKSMKSSVVSLKKEVKGKTSGKVNKKK